MDAGDGKHDWSFKLRWPYSSTDEAWLSWISAGGKIGTVHDKQLFSSLTHSLILLDVHFCIVLPLNKEDVVFSMLNYWKEKPILHQD